MPKNPMIPFWSDADAITCHAGGAISGRTLVKITGARVDGNIRVVTCGAGEAAFGVAAYDAASGRKLTVWREGILDVIAGAAVTGGVALKSDAAGKVIPQGGTGIIIGYAGDDAALNGPTVVDFRP